MNKVKIIPLGTFLLYFIKVCLQPVTLTEAAILLILGVVASFYEFKSNDNKIQELEALVQNHQKLIEDKFKELDGVKNQVAGIKLSNTYKAQQAKF